MTNLKPSSFESYWSISRESDHERTRLYPIVVHGTTFGRDPGSWWKRVTTDGDYPFCAKLSEQLKKLGVPFPVWINCEELDMTEFQWSGLNDHHARLRAGRELAEYINTCHKKCVEKFNEQPAFILIGHSHGGNVILASLGLLQPKITLAGIYLMGTPFILNAKKVRHEIKEDGREIDTSVYRNIYLSKPIRCSFHRYVATSEKEMDEVHTLFSLLKFQNYFRKLTRRLMLKLSERPRVLAIDDHPIADFQFLNVEGMLGFITSEGSYPSRWQRLKIHLRYYQSLVLWPFRWLAIYTVAPIVEHAFERLLFHIATGLNPILFKPGNILVSAWEGFATIDGSVKWIPLEESVRVGVELSLRDYLQVEAPSVIDVERLSLEGLAERIEKHAGNFKLMHTAYYRSDYVIQNIADTISLDLPLTFHKLTNWENISRGNGFIETVVKQPDGIKVKYRLKSEVAKLMGRRAMRMKCDAMFDRLHKEAPSHELQMAVVELIAESLSLARGSLGSWEKQHFASALAALKFNNGKIQKSTNVWLRLALDNAQNALFPKEQQNQIHKRENKTFDKFTYRELAEAIKKIRDVR